ncbi:MAG: sel1 repeat family protein [Deltaproteobacteria bacterium]|nr:sel1 repeat family protein [Deltaproteobacteria bacterium]MBW2536088.1 sel1 repeat family protein [Deltaproteobacteria bacterium]
MARAAATLVPALVLLLGAVLALLEEVNGAAIFGGVLGAYFLVYAIAHILRAWRTRASDALLSHEGIRFEGGAQDGIALSWESIDAEGTQASTVEEARLTMRKIFGDLFFLIASSMLANKLELAPEDKVPVRRLVLKSRDGRAWQLAEAEHPAEQRSLDALVGSVRAKLGAAAEEPRDAPEQVLGCDHCGAPLTPTAAESATCRFCGSVTAMPGELRQRVHAHGAVEQSQKRSEPIIAKLLAQPGARRANVILLLAAVASSVVWVPVVFGLLLPGVTNAGVFEVGWTLVSGSLAVLSVFILARAGLARRRALRLLTSSFGARAPRSAQEGYGCRRCGAPLPDATGLVAKCAYCEADNLLGLDFRSEVEPTQEHELSLTEALEARKRERTTWLFASMGAFVIAGIGGVMAAATISMSLEHAEQVRRCEAGKADACLEVARDFSLGMSVAEDEDQAYEYEKRACKLGNGEACHDLSERFRWGWAVAEDPDTALEYRQRSCKLGYEKACGPPED